MEVKRRAPWRRRRGSGACDSKIAQTLAFMLHSKDPPLIGRHLRRWLRLAAVRALPARAVGPWMCALVAGACVAPSNNVFVSARGDDNSSSIQDPAPDASGPGDVGTVTAGEDAGATAAPPDAGSRAGGSVDSGRVVTHDDSGLAAGGGQQDSGGLDAGTGSADDASGGGTDAEAANDPLNAPAQCTSKMTWTSGEDQNMRPGEACPTCHSSFNLAGTLYPTGHEPTDCDGVDGLTSSVTVVVTDASGTAHILYPNAVGNFFTEMTFTPPFTAKVVANGKERSMLTPQTSGSCNTCHTQTGANGAPGRITLPF
jgi:hypothetical protein